MTAASAPASVPTGDKIGVAAKALSDASYPFLKEVQGCKTPFEVDCFHMLSLCMHGKLLSMMHHFIFSKKRRFVCLFSTDSTGFRSCGPSGGLAV